MKNLTHPILIRVYLNEEEKRLLDKKMELSEKGSVSAFVRQLIKYGFVYTVDYKELDDIVRQLSGVANNINQIAHKVNGLDNVTMSDIENLQKEMDEIWHIVRSMLSEQPLEQQ